MGGALNCMFLSLDKSYAEKSLLGQEPMMCGVSFIVPRAITTGAVATRGLTWARSVRSVTSWCTPTTSVHWTNQTQVRELWGSKLLLSKDCNETEHKWLLSQQLLL